MKRKEPGKLYSAVVDLVFVAIVIGIWQFVAKSGMLGNNSALIFPSVETIGKAFVANFTKGYAGTSLWIYIANSMILLLEGLVLGIVLAFIFSGLSIVNHTFHIIYHFMVSVFDLLPGLFIMLPLQF